MITATSLFRCVATLALLLLQACGAADSVVPREPEERGSSPQLEEDVVSRVPSSPEITPGNQASPPKESPWFGLSGEIVIDGSSTVFPITEAVADQLAQEAPDLRVQLGVSGTGGGFEKFCRGELDISDASRPIKTQEAVACGQKDIEFVEVPIGFDGLSVVAHGDNDWARCITTEELDRLWQPAAEDNILFWNQVRSTWPERAITLYAPGEDSGTFDYFTHAIVGTESSSRRDFVASEDDYLLAQKIAADGNALGFFGYAYFHEHQGQLQLMSVDSGAGCVTPTAETILNGTYRPLSRPVFLYLSIKALDRPAVAGFVDFYLHHAARSVSQAGYVPLPAAGYRMMKERIAKRHHGSIFDGGSQVGVSIAELLRLEHADQGAQP